MQVGTTNRNEGKFTIEQKYDRKGANLKFLSNNSFPINISQFNPLTPERTIFFRHFWP